MASVMAFPYGVPGGVVGSVSRQLESNVDTVLLGEAFTNYGKICVYNGTDGKVYNVSGTTTAADCKGLLVRSVPMQSGSLTSTFNQATPNTDYPQGRLTRGYANVICTVGTPVKGGAVYVRTVAATGKAIGDIEATNDTGKNIVIPNAEWAANGKDANSIGEIFVKIN